MNLAYAARLLCLSLACFFVVNLAAGLAVASLANAAERFARRLRARDGARLLLALRLAPAALGVCVVGFLCVPSYLWMEPEAIDEPVGWVCRLLAALAVLTGLLPAIRAARAIVRSHRYLHRFPSDQRTLCVSGEPFTVHVLSRCEPVLALAGILRPRLIVSQFAIDTFPADELTSALLHEQAHGESHDNLKRLAMLLAPDVLPFLHTMRPLERAWAGLAEWAADDRASAGDTRRAISLASALVRTARFANLPAQPPDLLTAMLANGEDLSARVDRLLRNSADLADPCKPTAYAAGALLLAGLALLIVLHPAALSFVHDILEHLIR